MNSKSIKSILCAGLLASSIVSAQVDTITAEELQKLKLELDKQKEAAKQKETAGAKNAKRATTEEAKRQQANKTANAIPLAQVGEVTNKIGITMVGIPAGSFLMGSCKVGQVPLAANCTNADPDSRDDETPQRRVSIRGFQMGKTEVTLGQFKQFIAAAGRTDLENDDFMKYNVHGDNAPVVNVSWHDAQDFIKWLNQTDGGGYRLPSEAEWEYACRAGEEHKYCGGNDLNAVAWHIDNSAFHSGPVVGGKRANAWGLHDMSGSVREWVQDCWHDDYNGAPSDGSVWTSSCSRGGRVLRGGSWRNGDWGARVASRDHDLPSNRNYYNGFRLARAR